MNLARALHDYTKQHGGFAVPSPIGVVFSDYDVLQPDLVLFTAARAHLVDLDRAIRNPPDLCVEVISPSTERNDRGRKLQMFARFGVPEYWIVDPLEQTIEVYSLIDDAYALVDTAMGDSAVTSRRIAGLSFSAETIFP